jgi:hypothetical protein
MKSSSIEGECLSCPLSREDAAKQAGDILLGFLSQQIILKNS